MSSIIKWDNFNHILGIETQFVDLVRGLKDHINSILEEPFLGFETLTLNIFSIPKYIIDTIEYESNLDTDRAFSQIPDQLNKCHFDIFFRNVNNSGDFFKVNLEISLDRSYKFSWLYLKGGKTLGNLKDLPLLYGPGYDFNFIGTRTIKNPDRTIEFKGRNYVKEESHLQNYIQLPLGVPNNAKKLLGLQLQTILIEIEEVLLLVAKNFAYFIDRDWEKNKGETPGLDDFFLSLKSKLNNIE